MPDPSQPDEARPIGDAASLFDTDEIRTISPRSQPAPAQASLSDGYDLEGGPTVGEVEQPPPLPIPLPIPTRVTAKPKPKVVEPEEGSSEFETELSDVDPVWTRWGEWGPDLIRVGAVGLGSLVLAWFIGVGHLAICLMVLAAGGAAMVLMSYPMLITLERPVRITPEQAVNDFYAAASHHFPSYRRMWLLLSSAARRPATVSTFDGFRDHWKGRMAQWRRLRGVGPTTPLKFAVEGFRADKSTGKATSRADYTVHVYVRDQESLGPIESFSMAHGLVKGEDRMWYLNRGVLDPRLS